MRQVSWKRCLGLAGVSGALALGVFAADAAGDAQVISSPINGGTLIVQVPSGAGGDHKFFVEPFKDVGRDGWRVGSGFVGAPAITTSDSDCFGNFAFNDVVCNGERNALTIQTRDGADNVVVSDHQGGATRPCNGLPVFHPATVNLGGGGDRLTGNSGNCPTGSVADFGFWFQFVANGGPGNDTISAPPTPATSPDTLNGGPDKDTLLGRAGDDTIIGGTGSDEIDGGPGRDRLEGEIGKDTLNSRDGEKDLEVDCGEDRQGESDLPLTVDVATVDLLDAGSLPTGKGSVISNCEGIFAFAIDDGPPGALLGRRLRIREDGLTRVRIACPRAARVRCRGRASVRDPRHLARALASASYAIRLGARRRVVLKLSSAERALLRRRGRAVVTTREKGRSSRGPRGVQHRLGIAGS